MMAAIDHLVLPVASLAQARERLQSIGFSVAADGHHPFGTSNACIFFEDGTYLEPLAVSDPVKADLAERSGNTFVARDRLFRRDGREEGLSAIVLRSRNAVDDHARFGRLGMSGGERLDFSREARGADGRAVTASFRLAFADLGSDAFFAFTCERVNALPSGGGRDTMHPNGAVGLCEIILGAPSPGKMAERLVAVLDSDRPAPSQRMEFDLANAGLTLTGPQAVTSMLPGTVPVEAPLAGVAVAFRVTDLSVTESLLAANQLAFQRHDTHLVVAAAPGQGVPFIFQE